jgi:hypothetical protein
MTKSNSRTSSSDSGRQGNNGDTLQYEYWTLLIEERSKIQGTVALHDFFHLVLSFTSLIIAAACSESN